MSKKLISLLIFIALCMSVLCIYLCQHLLMDNSKPPYFTSELTPWKGIGGCGAGGSGGGTGDGIKWIGMGVSGGLIDIEVVPKLSLGKTFRNVICAPRLTFKPLNTLTAGINVPFQSKFGMVQYVTNLPEKYAVNGVFGDISIDLQKAVGLTGEYPITIGLTMPTGQYDTKRGADMETKFLPTSLQNGTGLWNLSLGIGKLIDKEDGIWLFDLSYSHPFAMRLLSRENEFLDTYYKEYEGRTNNRRFYYRFKPYGENDLGGFSPPSFTGSAFYGYRGIKNFVHSWGINFGFPLGVAWINNELVNRYDPRPDPDHKSWNATIVYGLEFSREKFPLFIAVSLPIHDKTNPPNSNPYDPTPMKKWDGPDWSDFGNQIHFAIGFKATLF